MSERLINFLLFLLLIAVIVGFCGIVVYFNLGLPPI